MSPIATLVIVTGCPPTRTIGLTFFNGSEKEISKSPLAAIETDFTSGLVTSSTATVEVKDSTDFKSAVFTPSTPKVNDVLFLDSPKVMTTDFLSS